MTVFSSSRSGHTHHSNYSASVTCYQCVPRPLAIRTLLLTNGKRGIFNMCNKLRVRCVHESETGSDESAQELTRKN